MARFYAFEIKIRMVNNKILNNLKICRKNVLLQKDVPKIRRLKINHSREVAAPFPA